MSGDEINVNSSEDGITVTFTQTGRAPAEIVLDKGATLADLKELNAQLTVFLNGERVEGELADVPLKDDDVVVGVGETYNG
jgi:hypothetical protein